MRPSPVLERLSRCSLFVQIMAFSLTLSSIGALQVFLLTGLLQRALLVFAGGMVFLSSFMGVKVLITERWYKRRSESHDPGE